MPSRGAIAAAWSPADKAAARQEMSGHREAERACVKVAGDVVTFNKACLKKAVPKGTNRSIWTD